MKKTKLLHLHYLVSITLFIFFLTGCKKGNTPPPEPNVITIEFSAAGLEYVNLTPGKYLIYKDSASGILDSIVVTKSLLETKYSPGDTVTQGGMTDIYPAFYFQEFSLSLVKVAPVSQTTWFAGSAITVGPSNFSPNDYLRLVEIYHFPGTATEYINTYAFYYSTQDPFVNIIIPSMTIEGKNYDNVIFAAFESHADVNDPEYNKRTFYWAKGIGIIKREITTTGGAIQTHTLLRHN